MRRGQAHPETGDRPSVEAPQVLCPACHEVDMFVLEFERIEVDYCYECQGVWLDSGELELIGERAGAVRGELLKAVERRPERSSDSAPRRRCPVCRARMTEVTTDTAPPIVVDRCPAEHGLWFDGGELSALVSAAGAGGDSSLSRFLSTLGRPDPTAEG